MEKVYLLWHTHEYDNDQEDSKLIGVYSSKSVAEGKINEYKTISGFKNSPDGFGIDEYQIDKDHWCEGFITET